MYEEFTQERISKLRTAKGDTARDMSLSLGQNSSYINRIENKKAMPSLSGLFYICEYFGITPQEFFDEGSQHPARLKGIIEDLKRFDDESLVHLAGFIRKMVSNLK
jgi:transcriptional regulator with XRE-family HTH domain